MLLVAAMPIEEGSPWSVLWTAPAILIAAMLIAWAAESAQFFIAQGFALAILAWLQTLPEFAVEAVLADQHLRESDTLPLAAGQHVRVARPEGAETHPREPLLRALPGYDGNVEKNRAEAQRIMRGLGYGPDKRLSIKVSTRNIPLYREPAVSLIGGAVALRLARILLANVGEIEFWLVAALLVGLGHIFWPV